MAKSVFILGAGASADAGIPIMDEFISKGLGLKDFSTSAVELRPFARMEKALTDLSSSIFSKSNADLDNIEDVFGLIEMGRLIDKFPGCNNSEEIEELRTSVIKFIVATIEHTNTYENSPGVVKSPQGTYNHFADELLRPMFMFGLSASVITFNYDIALDYALKSYNVPYDYSLAPSAVGNSIKYLKLHGSINWASCPKCNHIFPQNVDLSFNDRDGRPYLTKPLGRSILKIGSIIGKNMCRGACQTNMREIPILVPPTWNKTEYGNYLSPVWRAAAAELTEAENVFVIGYSLPKSDLFFKYLFSLGTINASRRLQRFWVFNPESSIKERFDNIVGPGIKSRAYRFFDGPNGYFDKAVDEIWKALGIDDIMGKSGF